MKSIALLTVATCFAAVSVSAIWAQTSTESAAIVPAAQSPAPDQVIYSPRLPSAEELTHAASAQNRKIDRIEQTSSEVKVVYRFSNGQIETVSYQLLPADDGGSGGIPVSAPTTPPPPPPTTTVVYAPAPAPVYYYPDYYPWWGWYPPVSLRVGVGFGYHHGWGGYHGGWRGGWRR